MHLAGGRGVLAGRADDDREVGLHLEDHRDLADEERLLV